MMTDHHAACFALLDDSSASMTEPRSRLYTGWLRTLSCDTVDDLPTLLADLQQPGQHAVLLMTYELGAALHGVAPRTGTGALAQVLLFAHCQQLSAAAAHDWLQAHAGAAPAGIAGLRDSIDGATFAQHIGRIRDYIAAGDTYQVNYTYRVRFDTFGTLAALYLRLRARQPVPYGALVALPDGTAVLSLSPELFVRHVDGALLAQPMKGTAAATGDPVQDAASATRLAADPKNRAENLMIVDLLRNDLGRIATLGSVAVPQLFEVTRFSDVLQMTSTVTARLHPAATLAQVVDAIYPCGSITGAPKLRTMQIIRELEADARGIYTGAIGWFDAAHGPEVGNFCLSVPIRTLVLQAPDAGGVRRGEMGIGAGIVHDSVAADEQAECVLKARFLTAMPNEFALFETMAVTRDGGCALLERHLHRLTTSAAYFGFVCDAFVLRAAVMDACAALPDNALRRLRLELNRLGECHVQSGVLQPWPDVVQLLLAPQPTASADLFLRHKTTQRALYDAAWRTAEAQGAFDMLFCNERGEVTEGARSNVFAQIDGQWFTPPLSAGVLPGVMRAHLLADPHWAASERTLTLADLRQAERLVLCNALRGVLAAALSETSVRPGY
ncbi:bifunctional anthranilate synthase component I family protein/class IV aminotransferase [Actimicrobium sp. CCI2.3]|uniref:bifunctional anthranilate synthase component I family protein/class IV aminotransferase n=1 Tax=Actimicrobium sp. CCI2.3 TaxID=3048616 RepID=UPI002AB4BDF1|nr:bifunctional anthranilate synthase component I family protein/class IV aminotransferase [Actimicrobium sp. CCI2.3]MDY7576406.1 bifunctional anthranilate synthase component I family protein/class IV aminotransferase [Actimicrobium sp. CCI2.3]MEB0024073.1 bifunctional anthranilate synthase component I family protein/class IV aminotransferase [Actimicrobium sp. CCI2.3]